MSTTCGERYRHLVKNGQGDTLDSPCKLYCDYWNADSWYEATFEMVRRVNRRWAQYSKAIRERGEEENPQVHDAVKRFAAAHKQLEEPEIWYLPPQFTRLVDTYTSSMVEGACVLEQLDEALRDIGEDPDRLPGVEPPKTIGDKIGNAIMLGGFVLGGFAVYSIATGGD